MVGHAVADFALQTDWLERFKYRKAWAGMPGQRHYWVVPMTAHGLIHGGAVALATGSVVLGLAELVAHWIIDFGKGEGYYGFVPDQLLHLLCKLLWVFILLY